MSILLISFWDKILYSKSYDLFLSSLINDENVDIICRGRGEKPILELLNKIDDKESYDETIEILGDAVEKSKLGYNDKSKALKRLHKATVKNENSFSPISFLDDLMDYEWKRAEKKGGMTFMGRTIKGVTRAIMSIQNTAMYGIKQAKN